MTITECTLRVRIDDLARAIAAVAKHAEPQKVGTEQSVMTRVRLTAGAGRITVAATDARSMALAYVPILHDSRGKHYDPDDGPFVVDLFPRHARAIGSAVTPITKDGEQIGEADLTLGVNLVTVADVSGKYPDTAHSVRPIEQEATMTIEGTEEHGYPDVEEDIRVALRNAAGIAKPFMPPARVLGRFDAAAAIFDSRMVYEPVGDADNRTWLVWARTAPFLGLLWHTNEDDAEKRRRASQRVAHMRRIGGIFSVEEEARLALGGDLDDDGGEADELTLRRAALDAEHEDGERPAGEDPDGFYDADNDPDAGDEDADR